jgi:ATP-dependent Lon protease
VHEAILSQYLDDEFPETTARVENFGAEIGKAVIEKLVEKLIEKFVDVAFKAVENYFKARAAEFKEAYAKPADGVTVKLVWTNLPGMPTIRAVISAMRGTFSLGNLTDLALPTIPTPDIKVFADKQFD